MGFLGISLHFSVSESLSVYQENLMKTQHVHNTGTAFPCCHTPANKNTKVIVELGRPDLESISMLNPDNCSNSCPSAHALFSLGSYISSLRILYMYINTQQMQSVWLCVLCALLHTCYFQIEL